MSPRSVILEGVNESAGTALRVVMLLVAGQTFIHSGLTALVGHRGDPPLARAPAVAPVPDFRSSSGAARRVGSLMEQFYAGQPEVAAGERVVPAQHVLLPAWQRALSRTSVLRGPPGPLTPSAA